MSRDTFHYPKLLQALSSLALDTSRDPEAATAALGTCARACPPSQGTIPSQYPIHPSLWQWEAIPCVLSLYALSQVPLQLSFSPWKGL